MLITLGKCWFYPSCVFQNDQYETRSGFKFIYKVATLNLATVCIGPYFAAITERLINTLLDSAR